MEAATRRLEGRPIAEERTEQARQRIRAAPPGSRPPTLASVHRPVEGPFEQYRRRQEKIATSLGIRFRDEPLRATDGRSELIERVRSLAQDPEVHAVIVEHPLPAPFDYHAAVDQLPVEKDVDGVSAESLGRLEGHRAVHVPAVARAALRIAQHYGLPLSGERVAVVGRSETVGTPLALLLAQRGVDATVTIAHSKTADLGRALADARTIFSCVGQPNLLRRDNTPRGSAIVDVGLSYVDDPARPGASHSVGDANAIDLEGWASALTPVPGGVGPVTVAELMNNVVEAWRRVEGIP